MATKNKTPDAPLRTPENTPVPGGGSWRWDASLTDWVENLPGNAAQPLPAAAIPTPATSLE